MNTYKVGDIVRLKSGGPAMTITSVGENRLDVAWFDASERFQSQVMSKDWVKSEPLPSKLPG